MLCSCPEVGDSKAYGQLDCWFYGLLGVRGCVVPVACMSVSLELWVYVWSAMNMRMRHEILLQNHKPRDVEHWIAGVTGTHSTISPVLQL